MFHRVFRAVFFGFMKKKKRKKREKERRKKKREEKISLEISSASKKDKSLSSFTKGVSIEG